MVVCYVTLAVLFAVEIVEVVEGVRECYEMNI